MSPIEFADRQQWREWLRHHHDTATEIWLVIYKARFRDHGLGLAAAVEEALCFGWIDSTLQPIDEQRYALRFSPRQKDSIWSMRNIEKVDTLIETGKMTAAGMSKVHEAKESGQWQNAIRREQVDNIPPSLLQALSATEGALDAYKALPPSRKKQVIHWLESAKRTETRERRIARIIAELGPIEKDDASSQ